ncbi:MAG: hypothetical protein ACRDO2_02000 [Nocardioidaceae bacterium]
MRRPHRLTLGVVALTAALALSGCGDDDTSGDTGTPAAADDTPTESATTSEGTQPVEPTTSSPTEEDEEEPEPIENAVEVDVTISDGEISPLGETVEAETGQQIRLVVDSDTHDEFHVHSDPEHEFKIVEGEDQVFTFSIDDPAVYEMESHELGVVIVKFQIS